MLLGCEERETERGVGICINSYYSEHSGYN